MVPTARAPLDNSLRKKPPVLRQLSADLMRNPAARAPRVLDVLMPVDAKKTETAPHAILSQRTTFRVRGRDVVMHLTARPYQLDALRQYASHIDEPRGKIVMACGTGKSRVALWIAELAVAAAVPSGRACDILLLLPSLQLVRQTLNLWRELAGFSFDSLVVCGDRSVGSVDDNTDNKSNGGEDSGCATTNSENIATFLRRGPDNPGASVVRVIFCTYHSSSRVGEAQHIRNSRTKLNWDHAFLLTIFDEAHKTAGLGTRWSAALHDQTVRSEQRLFLTATPRYLQLVEEPLECTANSDDDDITADVDRPWLTTVVASMDNPDLYGDTWFRLSYAEAVAQRAIVPSKLVLMLIDRHDGEQAAQTMKDSSVIMNEEAAIIVAVAHFVAAHGLRKGISYHRTNRRAERFVKHANDIYENAGTGIIVDRVDGLMETKLRERLLEGFATAESTAIIANARCLQEGIDLPALDLAILVDPKSSMTDILQLSGRVMRCAPGKRVGWIFVPLFLQPSARSCAGSNPAAAAGSARAQTSSYHASTLGNAVATLVALMAQDEGLQDDVCRFPSEGNGLSHEEICAQFPHFASRVELSALHVERPSLDERWSTFGLELARLCRDNWGKRSQKRSSAVLDDDAETGTPGAPAAVRPGSPKGPVK